MRTLGALIFPGFELLDLFGPLEMFGMLPAAYDLKLVAETPAPVASAQQVRAQPDTTLADTPAFDILLVPGGPGTRAQVQNQGLLAWLSSASNAAEYTLSVCTGSLLLAGAGLLDGHRATTNKAAFAGIAARYPNVNWIKQARWVEDGTILTSSGVSAGIDMALRAIEKMHGLQAARTAADEAEYTWNRDPRHDPFAALHGLT